MGISTFPADSSSQIASIQEGYVGIASGLSSGSGQDKFYYDVTISAVDTTKAVATVVGSFSFTANGEGTYYANYASSAIVPYARLTSSTNLRIHTGNPNGSPRLMCSWKVVEYA
jgi:hypothetical protein